MTTRDHPHSLMTGPRPGSEDAGQAVEVGGVGWGWGTRPKVGCWWWWWWSTTRRSMGRMAVAVGGTCMGSAAVLTSTGGGGQKGRGRGEEHINMEFVYNKKVFTMLISRLQIKVAKHRLKITNTLHQL